MIANRFQLTFANRADEAPRMARKIETFLQGQGIDEALVNKILLCVDELITNIIAHAYTDQIEHAVSLECDVADDRITLELRDDGVPFDPTTRNTPKLHRTLEDATVGGLGIHLVMTLMDHVEYKREGDYNVLTAVKMI